MQKKSPSKRNASIRDIVTKKQQEEETFTVRHIEREKEIPAMNTEADSGMSEISVPSEENTLSFDDDNQIPSFEPRKEEFRKEQEPKELVKVKFVKFVQLVTARDCSEVIQAHSDTDIVMSSNLLTELAGAHDEHEEKKIPLVFLVGLAIGVVLTYILITK